MPGNACKLLKSIYVPKLAGEIWGFLLHVSLSNWRFKISKFDERIYIFRNGKDFIALAIVFDDLTFAAN